MKKIRMFVNKLDKNVFFTAFVITMVAVLFYNPIRAAHISNWDRTFSQASMLDLDIKKRVSNFYFLFLLYIPIIFGIATFLIGHLFSIRPGYKNIFTLLSVGAAVPIALAFLSRTYIGDEILVDSLVYTMAFFSVFVYILALCDRKQVLDKKKIILILQSFFMTFLTLLFLTENVNRHILEAGILVFMMLSSGIVIALGKEYQLCNMLAIVCFAPGIELLTLRVIYLQLEKNIAVEHIDRILWLVFVICVMVAFLAGFIFKDKDLTTTGYVGSLISLSLFTVLDVSYYYTVYAGGYNILYEFGNYTTVRDTVLSGKLPIIDYFSAHALSDIISPLLYFLIHRTADGFFYDAKIEYFCMLIILFFIVKRMIGSEYAILMVGFLPILETSIRSGGICWLPVLLLVILLEHSHTKYYILFWLSALLGAFYKYDDGVSIGIGCIITYLFFLIVRKKGQELIKFLTCGVVVGSVAGAFFFVYSLLNDISPIQRIREWLTLTLGTDTTWGLYQLADYNDISFLFTYYFAPGLAIVVCIYMFYELGIKKETDISGILALVMAITQILFISRTIVFHNLFFSKGNSGVLFNFFHWTVAFTALYIAGKKKKDNLKVLVFFTSLLLTLLFESILVKDKVLDINNSAYRNAENKVNAFEMSQDFLAYRGNSQILFIGKFNQVRDDFTPLFNELLTKEQTFIEFTDITAIYALTDRTRPCYVGQTPGILTGEYSQKCYLEEVQQYDCPLAVMGWSDVDGGMLLNLMMVPLNVKYNIIAEYIYNNYRPLVVFGDFAVWCENDLYDQYRDKIASSKLDNDYYRIVDYGYDRTQLNFDENGNTSYNYYTTHDVYLGFFAYLMANKDEQKACDNPVVVELSQGDNHDYTFAGSSSLDTSDGNYLKMTINNFTSDVGIVNARFENTEDKSESFKYSFAIYPGENEYMIRVSNDYFWYSFNINHIIFSSECNLDISNVKILQGNR